MTTQALQANSDAQPLQDANGILPGTTFASTVSSRSNAESESAPESFSGPEVNGQSTTVTLYSPTQLANKPSVLLSLYKCINIAFHDGHHKNGEDLLRSDRLKYEQQFLDELGNAPGTFTYIMTNAGTEDVLATATAKRYWGDEVIAVQGEAAEKEESIFKRHGSLPADTEAWELSTMAVDPALQGRGIAGLLMRLVDEETKRRYLSADSATRPKRLVQMITTVKEKNLEFYTKRGFVKDYETAHTKGFLGSENGFHVIHMSRVLLA